MKIWGKIFLSSAIYVFLAIILAFFAYRGITTITTRLTLVEVADDMTNTIIEVRRYEKNFFLYRQKEDLRELERYLGILQNLIDNIGTEIASALGPENSRLIRSELVEYKQLFDLVAANLDQQEENVNKITAEGRKIEARLKGKDLEIFAVLRRYEKNMLLFRDKPRYDIFVKTYNTLETDGDLKHYRALIDEMFRLQSQEKVYVDKLRAKAREIQQLTESLSKQERAEINSIMTTSRTLLIIALLSILIVGAVVNAKLAVSIANPLRKLERITKKVAKGDFSETIDVKGKDEIASLALSFNQMEGKLKIALSSLEEKIVELREKQARLVEAEKHATIGVLASGVAHEINNPLTAVLTFSSLMLEQLPENSPYREQVGIMVHETEKARHIVKQLLQYSRDVAPLRVQVDIHYLIKDAIQTLRAQNAFEGIKLSTNFDESIPQLNVDGVLIGQVISNILLNAAQAITPPGEIGITTRLSEGFAEMLVTDTGCGIPPENLTKIFDPFFTTKEVGKGTGIGLAISYNIVKKHGGTILAESTPGKGSLITVRLPING